MPEGVPANESLVAYLWRKRWDTQNAGMGRKITHVPAQSIRQLARDYATTKPAALIQGWGPQRHICGERTARGSTLLASITGNVGIKGGWAAGYGGSSNRKFCVGPDMPENPVQAKISIMNWMQAADDASKVTPQDGLKGVDKLDSNIRLLFSLAGNYLANQNPDVHQAAKLLEDESKIEFIVLSDLFMTPSAKYADVLLPETSFMERWNIGETWGTASYLILSEKLIEPDFERRTDYDWLRDVAKNWVSKPSSVKDVMRSNGSSISGSKLVWRCRMKICRTSQPCKNTSTSFQKRAAHRFRSKYSRSAE